MSVRGVCGSVMWVCGGRVSEVSVCVVCVWCVGRVCTWERVSVMGTWGECEGGERG